MIEAAEGPTLELSVVDDNDTFANMAEEWRTLANQASACFFMSWDWHYTWWQVYSTPKHRLYLVRFIFDDKLVGLLPMYSSRQGFSLRHTLRFVGTGEARDDEVASEYLDLIALPEYQQLVSDAAIEWLTQCERWGKVELRFLLEDALLVKAYRAHQQLPIIERNVGHRFQVNLDQDEATHLQRISKSRSKRIERSRRALVKDGGLEQLPITNLDDLNHAFHQLAELNHERQAHKKRKSVFASVKFNQFHRQLVERVFSQGSVDIHQFKLNHSLLAVVYCFYDKHTCYYYQSGFSKKSSNKYMPLTFAHLSEIQRNRDRGRLYYDLMRAESPSYKEDFGCETTPMLTTFIFCSWWHLRNFNARKTVRRKLVASLSALGIKRNL